MLSPLRPAHSLVGRFFVLGIFSLSPGHGVPARRSNCRSNCRTNCRTNCRANCHATRQLLSIDFKTVHPNQLVAAAAWDALLPGAFRRGDTVVSLEAEHDPATGRGIAVGHRGVVATAGPAAGKLLVDFDDAGRWQACPDLALVSLCFPCSFLVFWPGLRFPPGATATPRRRCVTCFGWDSVPFPALGSALFAGVARSDRARTRVFLHPPARTGRGSAGCGALQHGRVDCAARSAGARG